MDDWRRAEDSPGPAMSERARFLSPARLTRSWPFGAGAAAIATLLVVLLVSRDPARWPSQACLVSWIGVLLSSFAGWGCIAVHAFGTRSLRGFLRLALGMVALLTVSGFLLAAHVLSYPVLAALVVVGTTVELWSWLDVLARRVRERAPGLERFGRLSSRELAYGCGAAVVLALAFLRVIGAVKLTLPWWDADDTPAYWAFIRELPARGSFDQSFSFRRLVAFGGQTVLQAVTCLGVPVRSANVFDAGLCPFVMVGIVLQIGRGRWLAIAVGVLLALLPTSATNSASNFSGSLLFLLVYFALRFAAAESPRRGGALVGMTAAALCTLRHSFVPGVGVLLAAAALVRLVELGSRQGRAPLDFFWAMAAAFAITISPWSLASFIASHTPLFPLVRGTYQGGGVDLGTGGPAWLLGLSQMFDLPLPVPQLLVAFAAMLASAVRLSRQSFAPLALGVLACTLVLVRVAPFNPADDVRYLAAPWLGLLVAFYCEALLEPTGAESNERRVPAALPLAGVAMVLVALQLGPSLAPGLNLLYEAESARAGFVGWSGERTSEEAARQLQAHVPAGKKLLAACDRAYLYDFGRNEIVLIDLPGVASPFELPDEDATPLEYESAIAELEKRGIEYLLFTNPDASMAMYSAARWAAFRDDGYRTHDLLAPRFAAWFGFERYVMAHRHISSKLGDDELAELGHVNGG